MLANYHTHTTFCDGNNTPEEVILYAIENGFSAIGFSGHGYTPYDLRYCMKDTKGYIDEINTLKDKYKGKIQIYCGVEEDAFSILDRESFDYIIGSSHYFFIDGVYYPVDSSPDYYNKCLEVFGNDSIKLARCYYEAFVEYILERKPDITGHFDLVTKFDEKADSLFLNNKEYNLLAEKYISLAAKSGSIFEVNTGAISRGYRTKPYPAENLLYVLRKEGAGVILSSDSHSKETISYGFDEAKKLLRDVGFQYVYTLDNGGFVKRSIS